MARLQLHIYNDLGLGLMHRKCVARWPISHSTSTNLALQQWSLWHWQPYAVLHCCSPKRRVHVLCTWRYYKCQTIPMIFESMLPISFNAENSLFNFFNLLIRYKVITHISLILQIYIFCWTTLGLGLKVNSWKDRWHCNITVTVRTISSTR